MYDFKKNYEYPLICSQNFGGQERFPQQIEISLVYGRRNPPSNNLWERGSGPASGPDSGPTKSQITWVQFGSADHSEDHLEGHLVRSSLPDRLVPQAHSAGYWVEVTVFRKIPRTSIPQRIAPALLDWSLGHPDPLRVVLTTHVSGVVSCGNFHLITRRSPRPSALLVT